jgi:hypothetical protein
MVAGRAGHRPATRPQGEERLAECPPDAGRRDTCAAASAARTGAVFACLHDRARRADDAQGLPCAIRSDRGSRQPFPIHPHMLRHGCGYALANAGHDTRALRLGSAIRTFNTRLDIPSWRRTGSRSSGADGCCRHRCLHIAGRRGLRPTFSWWPPTKAKGQARRLMTFAGARSRCFDLLVSLLPLPQLLQRIFVLVLKFVGLKVPRFGFDDMGGQLQHVLRNFD